MDALSPLFSALIGFILVAIGAVWIHKVSKRDKRSHRLGAIAVPMVGLFFLWSSAANSLPVVINDETEIIRVGPNWVMSRVEFDKTRECKIGNVTATIHYADGTSGETASLYLPKPKNKPKREYGYLIIQSQEQLKTAIDFYVTVVAECPFGHKVSTNLETVKIPESFNFVDDESK